MSAKADDSQVRDLSGPRFFHGLAKACKQAWRIWRRPWFWLLTALAAILFAGAALAFDAALYNDRRPWILILILALFWGELSVLGRYDPSSVTLATAGGGLLSRRVLRQFLVLTGVFALTGLYFLFVPDWIGNLVGANLLTGRGMPIALLSLILGVVVLLHLLWFVPRTAGEGPLGDALRPREFARFRGRLYASGLASMILLIVAIGLVNNPGGSGGPLYAITLAVIFMLYGGWLMPLLNYYALGPDPARWADGEDAEVALAPTVLTGGRHAVPALLKRSPALTTAGGLLVGAIITGALWAVVSGAPPGDQAELRADAAAVATARAAADPDAGEAPGGDDQAAARETADDPAETAIRDAYETGKTAFDSRKYETARTNLKIAAEGGHAEAQILLARMYLGESDLDRAEAQARYWLQKAMDQGNLEAQARLGALLIKAEQIPADAQLGYQMIRTAANAGSAEGQYRLGGLYARGQAGLSKSEADAVRLWKLAVAQGHIGAHAGLGWAYIWGETTPHDYGEGYRLIAIAAENENKRAQNYMGVIYAKGIGVEKDDSEALDWYIRACTNRYSKACVVAGDYFKYGRAGPKDPERAFKAYEIAWALDDENVYAMFELGSAYYSGAGVQQDYSEAMYYFGKAATHGHVRAITNVGSMFNNGQGVEEKNVVATIFFLTGALQGDARAAHFAATMLISNDLQYELWKSRAAKPTARMAKMAKEMTLWALNNGLEEEYRAQARKNLKWTNMFLGIVGFSVAHLPNLWDKYRAGKPDKWDLEAYNSYVKDVMLPELAEN